MLLFIDESGHDRKFAPYEVLAGVAVLERDLWNLIQAIRGAEMEFFGLSINSVGLEFKGRTLLKRKTFRFAEQAPSIEPNQRRNLVRDFLQKGHRMANGGSPEKTTRDEFSAYGQAVLAFVRRVFELAGRYHVRTFASIVSRQAAPPVDPAFLRKDYAYLFERFFYYLEDISPTEMGLIVFDELEKAQSRILLRQLEGYFLESEKGYHHSSRIVPEPFFVHSDLTTAVQLADIVGYCVNWGKRLKRMSEPTRPEMEEFGRMAADLQYAGKSVDEMHNEWPIFGMFYLEDLRAKHQQKQSRKPSRKRRWWQKKRQC